jgi:hypothetical protein
MSNFTFRENLIHVCQMFNIPYSYKHNTEHIATIVRDNRHRIDWDHLSSTYFQNMSIDFIREAKSKLFWYRANLCKHITEEHINHFGEYIEWHNVFWNKDYDDDFFNKYYGNLIESYKKVNLVAPILKHSLWVKIIKEKKISTECLSKFNNMGEIPQSSWEEVYK